MPLFRGCSFIARFDCLAAEVSLRVAQTEGANDDPFTVLVIHLKKKEEKKKLTAMHSSFCSAANINTDGSQPVSYIK